jgi:hypothetical protein
MTIVGNTIVDVYIELQLLRTLLDTVQLCAHVNEQHAAATAMPAKSATVDTTTILLRPFLDRSAFEYLERIQVFEVSVQCTSTHSELTIHTCVASIVALLGAIGEYTPRK